MMRQRAVLVLFILTLSMAGAAPATGFHAEDLYYSYYLGGFATNGAGAIPNMQWGIGVCQTATGENLHQPTGVGGACRLPLHSGGNLIWVFDEGGFMGVGPEYHQEGFWYRCIDTDGNLGPDWVYSDARTERGLYYAPVSKINACNRVDVVLPATATTGWIQVRELCAAPGIWCDDWSRPMTDVGTYLGTQQLMDYEYPPGAMDGGNPTDHVICRSDSSDLGGVCSLKVPDPTGWSRVDITDRFDMQGPPPVKIHCDDSAIGLLVEGTGTITFRARGCKSVTVVFHFGYASSGYVTIVQTVAW